MKQFLERGLQGFKSFGNALRYTAETWTGTDHMWVTKYWEGTRLRAGDWTRLWGLQSCLPSHYPSVCFSEHLGDYRKGTARLDSDIAGHAAHSESWKDDDFGCFNITDWISWRTRGQLAEEDQVPGHKPDAGPSSQQTADTNRQ